MSRKLCGLKQLLVGPLSLVLACAVSACALSATALAASPDASELAARIDHHLALGWETAKIRPAEPADDATFARRLYLDLLGRVPTVFEIRSFLRDKSSDKRRALAARLVNSGAHARHAGFSWRRDLVPQADTPQFALLASELDDWFADRLRERMPFDAMAMRLLQGSHPAADQTATIAFLAAAEFKPENLAANSSRAFLGINLDCAQCHNHPFSRWTQDQFWETAAFFARPQTAAEAPAMLTLTIPETSRVVRPRVLTGNEPDWTAELSDHTGREVFAKWVTSRENPYFAKNAVNRRWAHLFGMGLVEPLDDLSGANPASHPELLDELATAFAEHNYDLRYLTTALVLSKAYALSSRQEGQQPSDPRLFSRAAVRGLTGEQLYDSLRVAAGLPVERDDLDPQNAHRERKGFATQFRTERAATAQRSILQSLSMMNGKLTAELTSVEHTPTLAAMVRSPQSDSKEKVTTLFLAALSRLPSDREAAFFEKKIAEQRVVREHGRGEEAYADIFWALLNSSEFSTNH
jgi:hypothetical protein